MRQREGHPPTIGSTLGHPELHEDGRPTPLYFIGPIYRYGYLIQRVSEVQTLGTR